ncbi:MAG: 3-hydroxyacyl-CoA dehydrogenase NAD-binding domain-containing protein [Pseudomonadota bacterium]
MSDVLTITRDGPVAHVIVDNPPVNAVGQAVRQALWDAVAETEADDAVTAVVLSCAGRTFIAGADIREFDAGPFEPWLPDLVNRIHEATKPWIAAIHGTALGGGLETALGCHYRILDPRAKVGLPEVALGILPGAGGTQRLPRLVGPEAAVRMITSGKPVGAKAAHAMGLADRIAENLIPDALRFAQEVAGEPVPYTDEQPATGSFDWDAARDGVVRAAKGQISPVRAFDTVRRAFDLPLTEGLAEERRAFLELKETGQSKALRHAFFAERAVAKPSAIAGAAPRALTRLAVVGGGLMGSGIATAALRAGLTVRMIERDTPALATGEGRVSGNVEAAVARGLMDNATAQDMLARLEGATDYEDLDGFDMAIEAVFEDVEVKRGVFDQLARAMPREAILASNTSYIDPTTFTGAVPGPERVLGLHFFSPAHIMRLVEVVQTPETAPDVLATGFTLAKRMGKVGVLSGICHGFIGNRILGAYGRAAHYLLEDGALPWEVDDAMRSWGLSMGPFEMYDMAGLQIGWATRKRLAATRDPAIRYSRIADRICEQGWFGQKTGRGYYAYPNGPKSKSPAPEVEEIILDEARARGITRRRFSPEEIVERLHAVQVNEAAHILGEEVAERPMDVDIVKMLGYGHARWLGGPMFQADVAGTGTVLDRMRSVANDSPGSWKIAPLLEELGATDTPFGTLNR